MRCVFAHVWIKGKKTNKYQRISTDKMINNNKTLHQTETHARTLLRRHTRINTHIYTYTRTHTHTHTHTHIYIYIYIYIIICVCMCRVIFCSSYIYIYIYINIFGWITQIFFFKIFKWRRSNLLTTTQEPRYIYIYIYIYIGILYNLYSLIYNPM